MTNEYLTRKFITNQKLVILSVTKRCNLRCVYCRTKDKWYDALGQNSLAVDLAENRWKELLNFCREAGEVLITGGEPTEYPLIKEFISFLNNKKIRFSFHTNGVSNKWFDILKYLREYNLKPDIHLSIELFEDLQKELKGAELPLQFIKEAKNLNLKIELTIVLHQKLLPYLDQLKENLLSWIDNGVDSIFFQPIASVGTHFPLELEISESFIPFLERLKLLKIKNPILSKAIRNSKTFFDIIISLIERTNLYRKVALRCRMYDQIIFLNPDLKLFTCKTLWKRKKGVSCSEFFDFICCGFQT